MRGGLVCCVGDLTAVDEDADDRKDADDVDAQMCVFKRVQTRLAFGTGCCICRAHVAPVGTKH